MSLVVWAVAGFSLIVAAGASAQAPQTGPHRGTESPPADVMQRTPADNVEGKGADTKGPNKGDGITVGKDGDPIGATNDDQGRQGEAHSDPTLATKPPPASDPKFQ